jgi:hypothetical protein
MNPALPAAVTSPSAIASGSDACFTCLNFDPWETVVLDQDEQYKRDAYFYACAQCEYLRPTLDVRPGDFWALNLGSTQA